MTREETEVYAEGMSFADALNNFARAKCIPYRKATIIKLHELLDMGIKALEQESCEDCISRKALLEEIENGIKAGNYEEGYEEYPHINDMDDIIECIKYADSVQLKQKTGHWIEVVDKIDSLGNKTWYYKCSECSCENWSTGMAENFNNYCPNCGARMSESKYYAKLSKVFAQGLRQGLQDGFVESEE